MRRNDYFMTTKEIKNKVQKAFFSLTTLLLSTNLLCAAYFVSENGLNSNSGTSESEPFATISQAISRVSAGDTIFLMNGTYRNNNYGTGNRNNGLVANFTKSGNATDGYITLKNLDGHSPKIEFDGSGGIQIANGMNYIIIDGLEIQGPNASITYDEAIAARDAKISGTRIILLAGEFSVGVLTIILL